MFVQASVGVDGHLSDVTVNESLTANGVSAREFIDTFVTAMMHSKVRPIIVDGRPVVPRVSIPVHFNLDQIGKLNRPRKPEPADDSSRFVKPAKTAERPALAGDVTLAIDSPIKPLSTPGR